MWSNKPKWVLTAKDKLAIKVKSKRVCKLIISWQINFDRAIINILVRFQIEACKNAAYYSKLAHYFLFISMTVHSSHISFRIEWQYHVKYTKSKHSMQSWLVVCRWFTFYFALSSCCRECFDFDHIFSLLVAFICNWIRRLNVPKMENPNNAWYVCIKYFSYVGYIAETRMVVWNCKAKEMWKIFQHYKFLIGLAVKLRMLLGNKHIQYFIIPKSEIRTLVMYCNIGWDDACMMLTNTPNTYPTNESKKMR